MVPSGKRSFRLIMDMSKFDIDVFDEIGKYNYVNAQDILKEHIHPDMIEICYMSKGSQEYILEGESYRLLGGDIFISFPNEQHGSGTNPEEKGVLYWMVLKKPVRDKKWIGLSYDEGMEIYSRLLKIEPRLFSIGIASVSEAMLQEIVKIYLMPFSIYAKIEMQNHLIRWLLLVINKGESQVCRNYSKSVLDAISFIENEIFERINIQDLADMASLSLSHFKHLFKKETGFPPYEFILQKKIEMAKKMLKESDMSVTDIAYSLDFSSSSHFSVVFKQYSALSPVEFRKR